MSCCLGACQNERNAARKVLDKQKKTALLAVGLETVFERQFADLSLDICRSRRRVLHQMEVKFQQHLQSLEDEHTKESSEKQESLTKEHLAVKEKLSDIYSEILDFCTNVVCEPDEVRKTKALRDQKEGKRDGIPADSIEPQSDPTDKAPDDSLDFKMEEVGRCVFCAGREALARDEMQSHLKYIEEVRQKQISAENARVKDSSPMFPAYNPLLPEGPLDLSGATGSLDAKNLFMNPDPFLGLPPGFSLPAISEAQSLPFLDYLKSGMFTPELSMDLPSLYSFPGLADLPKSLTKSMVSQFFDTALNMMSGSTGQPLTSQLEDRSLGAESPMDVDKGGQDLDKGSPALDDALSQQKKSYSHSDLQHALKDVCAGKMGTRRASLAYGVPRSTIRNHLNKIKNYGKDAAFKMLDSEIGDSESIIRNIIDQLKSGPGCVDSNENLTSDSLMDAGEVSQDFVRHALSCHLENVLAQDAEDSPQEIYGTLAPGYARDTDPEYASRLRCAVAAVRMTGMSISKASAVFNIDTLQIRLAVDTANSAAFLPNFFLPTPI